MQPGAYDKLIKDEDIKNTKDSQKRHEKKTKEKEKSNDELSEGAEARLLRMIEQESDSDDEEGTEEEASEESQDEHIKDKKQKATKEVEEGKQGSENGSINSEEDILNRSLHDDGDEAIVSANYLRYASDKFSQKQDLLEIVDKNERSFKQVAEKMITQSSQLLTSIQEDILEGDDAPKRRLMSMAQFKRIAERFHGDVKVA